jgi:hypothetical protein
MNDKLMQINHAIGAFSTLPDNSKGTKKCMVPFEISMLTTREWKVFLL